MFVTSEKGPVPGSEGVRIVRTLKRKQAQRSSLFAPSPHPERAGQDMLLEPCTPQCQRQTLKNQTTRNKIRKYSFANYSFAIKVKLRTAVKKIN